MAHAKSSSKSISQQPCRTMSRIELYEWIRAEFRTSPHTLSLIAPNLASLLAGEPT